MTLSRARRTALLCSAAALLLSIQSASGQTSATAESIRSWLNEYVAAFNAKDVDALGKFYHPEVTIFEGGGIDRGWAAYREHHLGPELKALEELQFTRTNVQVQLVGERAAYVTAEYSLKGKTTDRQIDSGGLETLVVVRTDEGWRIRHSHTSSRRRPQP